MTESTSQPDAPNSAGATKKKPWLLIALCISLAFNLLIAGIIVGARMKGGPPHAAMMNNSAFSVGHAIRQFDDQRAAQLWPVARPHFKGLRSEMRQLRDAQREWERSFAGDPVNLEELDRTYAALHEHISTIQKMNFGAIRALAAELAPIERKQLLQALRKPRMGHHRKPRTEHAPSPTE